MRQLIKRINWIVKCPECDFNVVVGDIDKAEILHRNHQNTLKHLVKLYPQEVNEW